MCYYLNVHFQGQRVNSIGSEFDLVAVSLEQNTEPSHSHKGMELPNHFIAYHFIMTDSIANSQELGCSVKVLLSNRQINQNQWNSSL